ncbi:Hypothetical protein SRAE_1000311700 [Strongyloides ratti]|uniref:F-box domain-containing protein n=1 Tax=Strongyloides ratti TaxID=34506 RepID=A0A090MX59_STRRB|nr:Hypothetical protein SRAE_1000311700 [Strongyloides ratti]CEF64864.1 Hypothetical protein SRAE_1000311700 [Strongyloides ratti]
MNSECNISFIDIMRISLIRKRIIKNYLSISDLKNLSQTCQWMNYLVNNENVSRKMVWYNDMPHMKIHVPGHGFFKPLGKNNLNGVIFEKEDRYPFFLKEKKKFNKEIINIGDCICLSVENSTGNLRDKDNKIVVNKLSSEINNICKIRKYAITLRFMEYCFYNDFIIIHILSYLKHSNIKSIHIPLHSLMFGSQKYNGLKEDIFEGFNQLNEIVLFSSPAINAITTFVKNRTIINHIFKAFSKVKNATLVFRDLGCDYNSITDYIHMILEIAVKYEIKIKWDITSTFEFFNAKRNVNCSIINCNHFPLQKFVSSFSVNITNIDSFFNVKENLIYMENLETLKLKIYVSDFKMKLLNRNCEEFSLKNCKKLKKIILDFKSSSIELETEILHNDLKYLASLMPESVEKLELHNCYELTREVTEVISKYMPNIKVIIANNVSYSDYDSLESFKNLLAYISRNNVFIKIPNTVQLLAVGNVKKLSFLNDPPLNEKQVNEYSKRFSKKLSNNKDDYIFFNNIYQWDMYKNLLLNNFITF